MRFCQFLLIFCQLTVTLAVPVLSAAGRPNILIILADDLGYSDLGCYGGEIRTPVLDSLAANGLRFTRCYNSSRCCPSRASLLTGLYPHQAGIGQFTGRGSTPGYLGRLREGTVTIAEALGSAGYTSYASGKWHVNDPPPTERGFSEFYGFVHGYAVDSWNPGMMIRLPKGRQPIPMSKGGYYATDAITDHSLAFLDIARKTGTPWFLYIAYQAPHFPLQAPPELSAAYDAIYQKGWDVLRAERLLRMKELGLCPASMMLPPRSRIDNIGIARRLGSLTDDGLNPAWNNLPVGRRADLSRRMAVYAAMVEKMDSNIGRIIGSLRQHGEINNTLIVFLSDNGACAEWEPFGFNLAPLEQVMPGHGINANTMNAPNRLHTGDELKSMGGPGSLFSAGSGWANLCNTPLSSYKHYAREGGIRTPMIIHWPARIRDPGSLRHNVTHIMDLMATCMDVSGARYPENHHEVRILPMEGRSILPSIQGEAMEAPRMLVFEHEGHTALVDGDWKLVARDGIRNNCLTGPGHWQLYDLAHDPGEQTDSSAAHPERVRRMYEFFKREAVRTLILPKP